jgi:HlyD family secretion protein
MEHHHSGRSAAIALGAAAAVVALISCSGPRTGGVISASGTIEAREINIASKVGGQIRELRVDEGDPVKQGDVLALIDHDSLDIQLRQAEAGTELALAQLDLLRKGARVEDIRQGEEALRQAEAGLKVASDDAKRMRELAAKGSVTIKQRDDAEARETVSLAQAASAREALAKLNRLARPEEVRAAEARMNQARASADLLRKTIDDCTIVSSVSGIITGRPVEAGELIGPGITILTVSVLDSVHVMIYVPETDLGRIRLGQEAVVAIDSSPGRAFAGRVTYISPQAEFTPKNVQTREDRVKLVYGVKIEIPNGDGTLKPGMPADAVLGGTGTTGK